jgi:hypothetical protein
MTGEIQAAFEQAGCSGTLYVQSLADGADIGLAADELVISASVVKVLRELGRPAGGGS